MNNQFCLLTKNIKYLILPNIDNQKHIFSFPSLIFESYPEHKGFKDKLTQLQKITPYFYMTKTEKNPV